MADRKNLGEDAATAALLAAGKDAAKRAALDLLSTDEERAAKQAEDARASKQRRWKLIGGGVLVLCVIIGVIGMLVSYWQWFLLAGVLGLGGMFGWWRLRKRLGARRTKQPEPARVEKTAEQPREKREARPRQVEEDDAARALAEAEAETQSVEEELASMKARLDRERRP